MNLLIGVVTILASLANGVLVICYMPHDGHLDLPPIMQSSSYLMQDTPEMNEKSLYNSGVGLDTSDLGLQDNVKPTISNTDEHNFKDGQHFTVSNLDFYGNIFGNNENIMDKLAQIEKEIKEDEDIATKSALLIKLLQDLPEQSTLPLIYVEGDEMGPDDDADENDTNYFLKKRSGRYYRRYPWKRQNSRSRSNYDPESRYLCVPSRDDVYKLLIGLHENRKGNMRKTINFCNRKRQAKQIFTHIRFLG